CSVFGANFGMQLIDAALQNPAVANNPTEQRSLLHRRALYWLKQNAPDNAFADMKTALLLPGTDPGSRLLFAAELASANQQRLALKLLDEVPSPLANITGWSMPDINRRVLRDAGFFSDSEAHLRSALQQDLAAPAD
ncbi:MAG TPA: hypothetical protein PLD79_03715, partial [Halothiobacillus sp.]|nr:hypothetical protein [Halothiobacillus sp.]